MSINILEDEEGKDVQFWEECDHYFSEKYTAEEAINVLQDAINWIKKRKD